MTFSIHSIQGAQLNIHKGWKHSSDLQARPLRKWEQAIVPQLQAQQRGASRLLDPQCEQSAGHQGCPSAPPWSSGLQASFPSLPFLRGPCPWCMSGWSSSLQSQSVRSVQRVFNEPMPVCNER